MMPVQTNQLREKWLQQMPKTEGRTETVHGNGSRLTK